MVSVAATAPLTGQGRRGEIEENRQRDMHCDVRGICTAM